MPKPYLPTPDELQGATPLVEGFWGYQDNHGTWFSVYQRSLLALANTDYGRDLLLLDKTPFPVVQIRKNCVTYNLGSGRLRTDFRVGARWGNVIRSRWQDYVKAIDRLTLLEILRWPSQYANGRLLLPVGGGTTLTVYPDPNPETDTVDGAIKSSSTAASWDTHHDTATGISIDDSSGDIGVSVVTHNHGWAYFRRGMTLFDTAAIDAELTIFDATWSVVMTSSTYNFSGSLSLVNCTPANNDRLITADFNQFDTELQADEQTLSSFDAGGTNYNDFALTSTGKGNIAVDGITKIGIRIKSDVDDSEPTFSGDKTDTVFIEPAETTPDQDKDPKLVVNYGLVTFIPRSMMF